jgi:hypothetical protein
MDDQDGDATIIKMIVDYNNMIMRSLAVLLDEEERLLSTNIILSFCIHFNVATSEELLTTEAITIFNGLLLLVGRKHGGSPRGRLPNLERNREDAFGRLVEDYFSANPTYSEEKFRRRFRMRKIVFERIVQEVQHQDAYFVQRSDAVGRKGAHPIQKVTAALRLLAYGASADQLDEWIRLSESTILDCLQHFIKAVLKGFGGEYLRAPTKNDIDRMLQESGNRGFPGCLGSIDCWHWTWKNCPTAWKGHYTGVKGTGCTAEAVCGGDLWVWHLFVGNPGSLNDLNILGRSPLLHQLYQGTCPKVEFEVNGSTYTMPYWLGDGIYPRMATFVTGFAKPSTVIDKNFTLWHQSVRKDIERAFGVLQARWRILALPARHWDRQYLDDMVRSCVVLHNMIVEDERCDPEVRDNLEFDNFEGDDVKWSYVISDSDAMTNPEESTFARMLERVGENRNEEVHFNLREDLKMHLYDNFPLYNNRN